MQNQEMTMHDVVRAFESLLHEFALRSGGGDGPVITNAIKALDYLRNQESLSAQLNRLVDEVERTASIIPVLKAFELMKFERLVLFVEDVIDFSPAVAVEVRGFAKQIHAHLQKVRQLLAPYYESQYELQEVE